MNSPTTPIDDVTRHYNPDNAAVEAVLADLSKDSSTLPLTDLAGVDQFHSGGVEATRLLIRRAGLKESDRVLDVGGAFGGPARVLAHEIGCQVTVVDLTEAYLKVGQKLTERTGLTDRLSFKHGNALALPFEAESFDVVWTQHSSMNIADKAALYTQLHRVIRAGGRLAIHELTSGSGGPLQFPLPFARAEAGSFLLTADAHRQAVLQAGFRELEWVDFSDWTNAWFQERQRALQAGGTVLDGFGLFRLLGPDAPVMTRNFAINMQQGRIRAVQAVFERI